MATLDVGLPTLVPKTHSNKTVAIPSDVCGYIIAFLDNSSDLRTILACNLVSRIWLPIGQSKLFHSITFKDERSWALFEVFLFSSTPPHIAQYLKTVRELCIIADDPYQRGKHGPRNGNWYSEVLVECQNTSQVSNSLSTIEWTPVWRSSLPSISPYSSLEVLEINLAVVNDVDRLILLLSVFPTISHLILNVESHSYFATNPSQPPHPWPGFHSLTKLEFGQYKMVHWLGKLGFFRDLKHLTWSGEPSLSQRKWRGLIETIDASSLLSLCCGVRKRTYRMYFLNPIHHVGMLTTMFLYSEYVAFYVPHYAEVDLPG